MVAAVVVFLFFKSKSKRKKLSFFILGALVSAAVTQKHTSESCRGLFLIKKKAPIKSARLFYENALKLVPSLPADPANVALL